MSRTKLEGLWELVSLQSCDAVGTGISIVQCIRNGATPTSLGLKPLRRHDLPTPGSPERGGLSADVERLRRTKTNPGGRSVTCNRTLTNDYSLESENKSASVCYSISLNSNSAKRTLISVTRCWN